MNQQTTFTADEIVTKYDISMSSLKRNFTRTQQAIEKKYGVKISKQGRGDQTCYFIENFNHSDPARAVTLYESFETNNVPMNIAVGLLDLNFLVFIGIISSPQRSFRGSYFDLLSYLDIPFSSLDDINSIRCVLQSLMNKHYIMYLEDPSDPMYFMAAVQHQTEQDMELEISAILAFKKMVANTRKSWIPLMKTYFALYLLDQPCTINELSEITHLTSYKVKDSLQILAANNVIIKDKVVQLNPATNQFYCLGSQIDINAFSFNDTLLQN